MNIYKLLHDYNDDFVVKFGSKEFAKDSDLWQHKFVFKTNGVIAVGWLENDNIVIIGADTVYIIDINNGDVLFKDSDLELRKIKSANNDKINFLYKNELITVNIFGLSNGNGNLSIKDWKLKIINIRWNLAVPAIWKHYDRIDNAHLLELTILDYEGYMYAGFSNFQNHFLIMGDNGIEVFQMK